MDDLVKYYRFDGLLQQQGWIAPAYVGIDGRGYIKHISSKPPQQSIAVENVRGYALPGFQNAHSHAFQYAMAGVAEKHLPGTSDDFWSWREAMYDCALNMQPDQLENVAAMLYAEMLRHGYTHVAEFHYLHHDINGRPYANVAETGERLLAAAKTANIQITLIPVFYQMGGFGRPPEVQQRRFISSTIDDYFSLLQATTSLVTQNDHARLGFGVHSLRAVNAADVFKTFEQGPKDLPFHLHASEQLKEVEDSVKYLKQRPARWLLDNLPLNERFNIVHCTHMDDSEVKMLAQTRANVVLCPGTEGNLGDGIFRLKEFANHYGNWSIGTDSQISLNLLEDLRWLDYAQRLTSNKRNTFDDGASVLLNKVISAGRSAMGTVATNFFDIDSPLHAVVYYATNPLFSLGQSSWLASLVYTSDASAILGTIVNGKWIVANQQHINRDSIFKLYQQSMKEMRN